jgi:hypothetical protein
MSDEKKDILPDSRLSVISTPKGTVRGHGLNWEPIFCANCGCPGGFCPEENMDFMFYLCDRCVYKYGKIAGTMLVPDEVFYEKVRQEQLASYGRELSPDEVLKVLEEDASPLSKLVKSRHHP